MSFFADFHIHSHYSLATSKTLEPVYLDYWARIKGISLLATGDFTHPGWTDELKEKLSPAETGLFKLKKKLKAPHKELPESVNGQDVRFLLQAEISTVYKKNGRTRKVHTIVLAPDFKTVTKIQKSLQKRGANITSDGRPIIGMDARDLAEICLEANEDVFIIPAHIWTPWFSVLGAKSGFDSVEECYEDLAKYIHAVETGLSTDAYMNRICSSLDKYTLLSNSDAHSPEKLGRNANILDCKLSYADIIEALKHGKRKGFLGTVDMFPQEGKYHFDGHRKCGFITDPAGSLKTGGICPVCEKPLTMGVCSRICQLSDRAAADFRKSGEKHLSIVPLKEILSEIYKVGPASKKIHKIYMNLISNYGTELDILLNTKTSGLEKDGLDELANSLERIRSGKITVKPGFDGEYGKVFANEPLVQKGHERFYYKLNGESTLVFDPAEYLKERSRSNG